MNEFVQQHAEDVTGAISGWDRLRFRGTLRMLANVVGMDRFMRHAGVLLKDFGRWAEQVSRTVRRQSLAVAEAAGRPVEHLPSASICKEDKAREIAARDGITEGLICALTAEEYCGSYKIKSNTATTGKLELVHAPRRCQHIYHYFIDPVFGFGHVRLQTWLPFNQFVCLNGREWLSRQMDAAGIGYLRRDNCFAMISDPAAAQRLLDEQVSFNWQQALEELGHRVNPACRQIIGDCAIDYYWSLEESEWATDVMFRSPERLAALYPGLIRHGMQSFGCRDVLRFLGHKVPVTGGVYPQFAGEVCSDLKQRPEGLRLKHRVKSNTLKMYDKQGSVLRIETTLNNVRELKAPRREEGPEGDKVVWKKMRKGVSDIARRAEVSAGCNRRYLEAMAAVATPVPLKALTEDLAKPVLYKGPRSAEARRVRGLNLLGEADATLLEAAGRGEWLLNGFRNRDLQGLLYEKPTDDPKEHRRRSGQVSRKLRMLRAHGLIAKVSRTHRYQVTAKGRQVIAALLAAREANVHALIKAA